MQAIDASENVDFNLHTHVECNSPLLPDSKTIVISTHVECDRIFELHFMTPNISTHALTWSATLNIVLKKDSPHSIWEVIAFYHQLS